MKLPGFTAERSLEPPRGRYRSSRHTASRSGAVVPAIPNCANCDYILDRCAGQREQAARRLQRLRLRQLLFGAGQLQLLD